MKDFIEEFNQRYQNLIYKKSRENILNYFFLGIIRVYFMIGVFDEVYFMGLVSY